MLVVVLSSLVSLVFLYFMFMYFISSEFDTSRYSKSDNFYSGRFHLDKISRVKKLDDNFTLKGLLFGEFRESKSARIVPDYVDCRIKERVKDAIKVTYIGHATHLIQVGGVNILTDPVFSDRIGFGAFTKKRTVAPACTIGQLPKIDYVFISHNHYDHMDKKSILLLDKLHAPTFLTMLGNEQILENDFCVSSDVKAFDWFETHTIKQDKKDPDSDKISLKFLPAVHFSSRFGYAKNKALWGGLAVHSPNGVVYYAGDTEYDRDFFERIKRYLGYIEIAILPIKASRDNMSPSYGSIQLEEVLDTVATLDASNCLLMQSGVFQFKDEMPYGDFLKSFKQLEESAKETTRAKITLQHIGSEVVVKHSSE